MAGLTVTLTLKKRWWFNAAVCAAVVADWCGLINDERGTRFAHWLVAKGMRLTVV